MRDITELLEHMKWHFESGATASLDRPLPRELDILDKAIAEINRLRDTIDHLQEVSAYGA